MENKDLDLKLLTKLLFSAMGYSTHFEVKLRNKSYVAAYKTYDVSDIDVLGLAFHGDMSLSMIGAECKSGENNAIEEFYKFFGIGQLFGLDLVYLIKNRIHQNARQLALKHKSKCFTESELRKILASPTLDLNKTLKIEKAKYRRQIKSLSNSKVVNEKLIDYLQLDYWNRENWKNIHNLIHVIQPIPNGLFDSSPTPEHKYVYYYALWFFIIAILKNVSEAIVLGYSDFERSFITSLYGGADSLHERRRIQDAVNVATQQNIQLEAEWQSDLLSVCERLSNSTFAACKIPLLVQEICENCFFDDRVFIDPKVLSTYPDLTRKFLQDIAGFLAKTCKLNESIFQELMAL